MPPAASDLSYSVSGRGLTGLSVLAALARHHTGAPSAVHLDAAAIRAARHVKIPCPVRTLDHPGGASALTVRIGGFPLAADPLPWALATGTRRVVAVTPFCRHVVNLPDDCTLGEAGSAIADAVAPCLASGTAAHASGTAAHASETAAHASGTAAHASGTAAHASGTAAHASDTAEHASDTGCQASTQASGETVGAGSVELPSRIDWTRPAGDVARLIRAFAPFRPGAWTTWRRMQLFPGGATPAAGSVPVVPGTVLEAGSAGLLVAAGEGMVRLTGLLDVIGAVDPAGVAPGEVLGGDLTAEVAALQQRVDDLESVVRRLARAEDLL